MPTYLINGTLWRDLWPIGILGLLVALLLTAGLKEYGRPGRKAFTLILAMTLLGGVTGLFTGQSRAPAVGTALPAVLGIIGGLTAYLFASKDDEQQQLTARSIIGFTVTLLVCAYWGAAIRGEYDRYLASEVKRLELESIEQNIRLQKLVYEKQLLEARAHLGLPTIPPAAEKH